MSQLDDILRAGNPLNSDKWLQQNKQQIKNLFINLVEQESFYDPETKQTTFYSELLVKRIMDL